MAKAAKTKKDYNKLRNHAAFLYIQEGWKQNAIADYLEVSTVSISAWKDDDKWDDQRAAFITSPRKMQAQLMEMLTKVMNGEKLQINPDDLSKISKVIKDLRGSITPEIVYQVLKELDTYLTEVDPQHALVSIKHHRNFLLQKINEE